MDGKRWWQTMMDDRVLVIQRNQWQKSMLLTMMLYMFGISLYVLQESDIGIIILIATDYPQHCIDVQCQRLLLFLSLPDHHDRAKRQWEALKNYGKWMCDLQYKEKHGGEWRGGSKIRSCSQSRSEYWFWCTFTIVAPKWEVKCKIPTWAYFESFPDQKPEMKNFLLPNFLTFGFVINKYSCQSLAISV